MAGRFGASCTKTVMGILLSILPALAGLLATGVPLVRYRRENRRLAGMLQQSDMQSGEGGKVVDEAAAFYRMLLESVSVDIVSYGPDARIRYVNPGASKTLGIAADKMLGKTLPELFQDNEQLFNFEKRLERTLRHGEEKAFELELPGGDGTRLYHVRLLQQRDAAGKIAGAVAIGQDITERRQVDLALAAREREFRSLASMVPVAIVRFDGECQRAYANPAADKLLGHAAPSSSHLLHQNEPEYLRLVREVLCRGVAAHVEMALRSVNGEAIWGGVSVVPEFDSMGKVAGALLVVNDITRHKRYEQVLLERAELEQRLSSYIGSAPGFFFTLLRRPDGAMSMPFASPGIAGIYGLQPEDVAAGVEAVIARDHPEDVPRILQEIERSGRNLTPCRAEFRVLHPEKGERWVEARSMPQRDEDGGTRWHGFMHDISERKRMELALAQSEREFRSLAANIPDNIARWDSEGRYLYINPTHERTLGKSFEEVVGTFIPDSHGSVKAAIKQVAASGLAIHTVRQAVIVNGIEELHDVSMVPELDEAGCVVSLLGIGRDMTETYRMQETIAAREQEFRALVERSSDTIARFDRNCRRTYVNAALARYAGLPASELLGSKPSDYTALPQAVEFELRIAEVFERGREEVYEYVWPAAGGAMITTHVHLIPEFGDDGRVVSVLAIGRDISELKEVEGRLAESHEMLRRLSERRDKENEEARRSVAWEIYDTLGQKLMALRMELVSMAGTAGAAFRPRIEHMNALVGDAIGVVREVSHELRPVTLDMGLAYGLEWLADEYAKTTGRHCRIHVEDEAAMELGGPLAIEVFRIAEQALENVAAHAEANHVSLCWQRLVDCYLLEVRDDGGGFDLDSCWSRGLGLLDMRERANRLGAELIILSTPGSGTLIELRVPIAEAGQMQLWSEGQGKDGLPSE